MKEITNKSILDDLFRYSDENYKKFHSSLCPNNDNDIFIGIRIPVLRKYAKELLKENKSVYYILENVNNYYYEEVMLKGMLISLCDLSIEEKFKITQEFIPKIMNWAVCDIFCSDFKFKKSDEEKVWNFINRYKNSNKEFEKRFFIVMILTHFINENYIDEIIKLLDNIECDKYYVQMAIAWLISIAYVKYKEKTEKYLKKSKLSNFTYNKAIQKIIESLRVSKEDKERLKKMKRK